MGPVTGRSISRRHFLAGSLAFGVATAWAPIFRFGPADARTAPSPPGFPPGVDLYRQAYQNWDGAIRVDAVWTCAPRSPEEVVDVANWAQRTGWRVRAKGKAHGWSPLTVSSSDSRGVVLVDTTQHLTAMRMIAGGRLVVVQTGATMDSLLDFLERHGRGVTACPAPGDVTVGGVLAIGGHGNAVAAHGEKLATGHTYGTMSNLVASLTAVMWDPQRDRFTLRTFDRSAAEAGAFMVHLGRAFLTEVTLVVGQDQNLRCVSVVDTPATELYGHPRSTGRTLEALLDTSGRVGTLWFPFTDNPWIKASYVAPQRPVSSRVVNQPYNYPFTDRYPDSVTRLIDEMITGRPEVTPQFCQGELDVSMAGLVATHASDIWGPSKNSLLYVRPTTLRVSASSHVVVTRRDLVQTVVHDFATYHRRHLDAYAASGRYPINGPNEIRVTGVDNPADIGADVAPALSAVAPVRSHPEWDTAVWLDTVTFADTPAEQGISRFHRETEDWIYARFAGRNAVVRPEWSKGWAHSDAGAWTNLQRIRHTIPDAFRTSVNGWDWAAAVLNAADPHRVFSNSLLDLMLPA